MTKRKMLLLIIGSLITVSTAMGVGINYAIGNGSQESSTFDGIDTTSPNIARDDEEINVIDKDANQKPSTAPAKVEINDNRTTQSKNKIDNKEKKDLAKPNNSAQVVVRKKDGTENNQNTGSQLIIGDTSKLDSSKKDQAKPNDNESKTAVVIIPKTYDNNLNKQQDSTPAQSEPQVVAKIGVKNESQEQKEEQPVENSGATTNPSQQTNSEDEKNTIVSTPSQENNDESNSQDLTSVDPNNSQEAQDSDGETETIDLIDNSSEQDSNDTQPTFTQSQITVLNAINDFKNVQNYTDLEEFTKTHTIRPDEASLFFANIPKEWIRNAQKQNLLRSFWRDNVYKISNDEARRALSTPAYRQGEQYTENPDNWFNRELHLADTEQLNGQIISGADSFLVKGVPPKLKEINDGTP